jgi:hypothetical protein
MKKLIWIILVICSILFGCKKDIVEPIGLLGSWELVSVDTCYRSSPFSLYDYSELVPIEGESGKIDFFNDSTGYLELSDRLVVQNNSFSWKYTNLSDTAHLFFPIYISKNIHY